MDENPNSVGKNKGSKGISRREALGLGAAALTAVALDGLPVPTITQDPDTLQGRHDFPWGKAALDRYSESGRSKEQIKNLSEVIDAFFEQSLNNMDVFPSKEGRATFPYTVIKIKDLAKTLHEKYGSPRVSDLPKNGATESESKQAEFVIGSFLNTTHGHAFGYCEQALHQVMKFLPTALEDLMHGREPGDIEIYTLGAPTNEMGHISPEFAANIGKDPFRAFGHLYADFVREKVLKDRSDQKLQLTMTGYSMGSNFAAEAAQTLINAGVVTQERDPAKREGLPHLTVNMYIPAAQNDSTMRMVQVPLGLAYEGLRQRNNPSVKMIMEGEKGFALQLKEIFKTRDIPSYMDREQETLKNTILNTLLRSTVVGAPARSDVSARRIIGLDDPLMSSAERTMQAEAQKRKIVTTQSGERVRAGKTLGAYAVPGKTPKHLDSAVKVSHTMPFFRPSEFRRQDRVSERIARLKKLK